LTSRRVRQIFWLFLALITVVLPSGAYAEDVGPQGSAENFIPKQPPIENNETPIYERFALPAYKLDSEPGAGMFSVSGVWDAISNGFTAVGNIGGLLTIYALHFLYTEAFGGSMNQKVGEWTLSIRDHLFIGEFMGVGLVVLAIILVLNMGKPNNVAENVGRFLKLFLVATLLLSFMTPLLNFLDRTERMVSDTIFWVYLAADPSTEEVAKPVPDDDEAMASYGQARNKVLVKVASQFWTNFRLIPWQMAEFGSFPIPDGKDDDGNLVYSGKDKQIQEDTKRILNLNPLDPEEFVEREKIINEWTNNSVWGSYVNNLAKLTPGMAVVSDGVSAVGSLIDAIQKRVDKGQEKENNEVRYPSMTAGNSLMRMITVAVTFLVGTVYGCAILFFAGIGLIMKFANVILAVVVSILLFSMFVPQWGWSVITRWTQYFLTTALYKVLLSIILIVMLFISGLINSMIPKNTLGLGLYLFGHLCFGIALFLSIKWLWDILLIPARIINEAGAILREGAKKGASIGLGSVVTATRAAAAAVTGNPAFLAGSKGAFMASLFRQNKGQNKKSSNQNASLKSKEPQFVPEGFSHKSSQTPNFAKEIAPNLNNPYQDDSPEAMLFNDMKEKGYNPYASQDQRVYEKNHLKKNNPSKETMQAFNNLKDHSREFSNRQQKQERIRRRSEVVSQLDQMAQAQKQREAENSKQKKNSMIRRSIHSMRQRAWGKK